KLYSVVLDVDYATYQAHPEGSHLSVVYLQSDPGISQLDANYNDPSEWLKFALGFLILIGIALFALGLRFRRLRRDRAFGERGKIIEGSLISCMATTDKTGDYTTTIKYQFQTPSGRTFVGEKAAVRQDLVGESRPPHGTPVAVLYVDDNLYQLM